MNLLTGTRSTTSIPLALLCLLSACATLIPNEYLISQLKLSNSLQNVFPIQQDIGNGLFNAKLDSPELKLDAEHNRISLTTRYEAYSIVSGTLQGELAISGALRFDPEQRAIYLQQPKFDGLSLLDAPQNTDLIRPVVNTLLVEYLRTHALYRFQADELRFAGTDIDITGIDVVSNGIRVKLSPKSNKRDSRP